MSTAVVETKDPRVVLDTAAGFLASDPVAHNVVLTILYAWAATGEPGRYWILEEAGRPVGVVLQSPLEFMATFTPMPAEAVVAVVNSIVEQGIDLPGLNGDALTAARFAGEWTERTRGAATPVQGQRIYEVTEVAGGLGAPGHLRPARDHERELLIELFDAFGHELGDTRGDAAAVVDYRLPKGQLWVWDDGGPVATAGLSAPVHGVSRIGPVYTPPERRNVGYASALVAGIASAVLARNERCILYTDLGNATSNSIYRAIGFRAVGEGLRYRLTR